MKTQYPFPDSQYCQDLDQLLANDSARALFRSRKLSRRFMPVSVVDDEEVGHRTNWISRVGITWWRRIRARILDERPWGSRELLWPLVLSPSFQSAHLPCQWYIYIYWYTTRKAANCADYASGVQVVIYRHTMESQDSERWSTAAHWVGKFKQRSTLPPIPKWGSNVNLMLGGRVFSLNWVVTVLRLRNEVSTAAGRGKWQVWNIARNPYQTHLLSNLNVGLLFSLAIEMIETLQASRISSACRHLSQGAQNYIHVLVYSSPRWFEENLQTA